ncbi:MAG: metallophosphoesterase [Planctomycetota bacterium]|nr:metallophosphoesterase [Planctomycetota bacterium]
MAPPTVHTVSDPEFDELYVISDLHMGGKAGFQLFNQGKLLSRWIDSLAAVPAAKRVALVINGDMVDFLAEPDATYFDPRGAVNKLNRIAGDSAFKPVFDSLAKFTGVKNRHLVVTLGNHDLELMLPNVQTQFLSLLTGGNVRNRPRVTLDLLHSRQ